MVTAAFVAPYLLDTTARFVEAAASLPGVSLALVTCEPTDRVSPGLRHKLTGHWRIDDPLDAGQIAVTVPVAIKKAANIDVVEDRALPPRPRHLGQTSDVSLMIRETRP